MEGIEKLIDVPHRQRICALFGLGDLASIDKAGGTRNTSFVFRTNRGQWLVRKRYRGYSDEKRVQFDHQVLRLLAQGGVPVVAPALTVDGDSWWRDGDDVWEVYALVEGRHLRDGFRDDVIPLAESLAHFHRAGRSFQPRYEKLGPWGEGDPERLRANIEKIRAEGAVAGAALQPYREMLERAAQKLSLESYLRLPHTLVHGDVQPANILVKDGRIAALVDLDWCAWRPRLYDLCFALICCCAAHDQPVGEGDIWALTQTPRFDADLIREFLSTYESNSAPLSSSEGQALAPLLDLAWCHMRIDGALKVPREQRHLFLTREPAPRWEAGSRAL